MNARRLTYATAFLFAGWVLVPIYLLAVSAVQKKSAVFEWPKHWWPEAFSLETLSFFFGIEQVWEATLNSIIVAVLTVFLALLLGAPAGYALARYEFRGKDAYRLLILMTRAFPVPLLALPLAVRFLNLGLYDTPLGVAIVHTCLALPFAALVTSSLFLSIPRELEEAAWTLGCSRFQALMRVVMPIALPGLAASAVFAFVVSWNEAFASTLLTLRERTLPAYILATLDDSPLYFKFAGGFFLIVPAMVFIFAVRRYLFSLWGIANR